MIEKLRPNPDGSISVDRDKINEIIDVVNRLIEPNCTCQKFRDKNWCKHVEPKQSVK